MLKRFAVLWLFLVAVPAAFADNSKISPDLQQVLAKSPASTKVIVQYNSPLPTAGLLGGLLGGVLTLVGGLVNTVFSLIPALSATLTGSQILSLSNESAISYISLDRAVLLRWTIRPRPSTLPMPGIWVWMVRASASPSSIAAYTSIPT